MNEAINLKESNTWKTLIKYSLPLTVIGVINILIALVDFLWVYVFVKDIQAFSALRVSSSILLIMESVAVWSSLLVYMNQQYGAGKLDQTRQGIYTALHLCLYCGLLVTFLGICFAPYIISLFGVNKQVQSLTWEYLLYIFIGYLFISLKDFLLLLPRYFGYVKMVRNAMVLLFVGNLLITPIIMIIFQGLNASLISGAAVGTVIANMICLGYLIYMIFLKNHIKIGLSIKTCIRSFQYKIIKINLSYMISQLLTSVTFNFSLFLYMLILSYYPGDIFSVYAVSSYAFMIFNVFAQHFAGSLIPIVSQNVGAKNYELIINITKQVLKVLLVYGLICVGIIIAGKEFFIRWIIDDPSMGVLVSQYINLNALPWILNTMGLVFVFVVAGSGDSKGSMTLTILNMYVVVILTLLFVPRLFKDISFGVFFSLGLIQILTFVISGSYYLSRRWQKNALILKIEAAESESH